MLRKTEPRPVTPETWAVVNAQPHREHLAFENLARQGFDAYLPRVRKRRRHARKTDYVLAPLFPGYLFVRIEPEATLWRPILSTKGVCNLVRFGDQLAFLDDGFISGLRAREDNGVIVRPEIVRPKDPYREAQEVRFNGGPLDGLVAQVLELEEQDRLLVLMNFLHQRVRVRVTPDQIMPM